MNRLSLSLLLATIAFSTAANATARDLVCSLADGDQTYTFTQKMDDASTSQGHLDGHSPNFTLTANYGPTGHLRSLFLRNTNGAAYLARSLAIQDQALGNGQLINDLLIEAYQDEATLLARAYCRVFTNP